MLPICKSARFMLMGFLWPERIASAVFASLIIEKRAYDYSSLLYV